MCVRCLVPLPLSQCYCVCCSCCGSVCAPARSQVSETAQDSQDTGTGQVPTSEPPIRPHPSPKPHTALGNSHVHNQVEFFLGFTMTNFPPVIPFHCKKLEIPFHEQHLSSYSHSLTLMLHLHPSLSHVHLLVLQQLLWVHQEGPTLQTLVLLGLPNLLDTLDGHGLPFSLSLSLLASVDLLVDQHILQGVEELMALTAHILVLHVHTLCLLLLPGHAADLWVCCVT